MHIPVTLHIFHQRWQTGQWAVFGLHVYFSQMLFSSTIYKIFQIFKAVFLRFIYLERESSRQTALSTEPNAGLDLMTLRS